MKLTALTLSALMLSAAHAETIVLGQNDPALDPAAVQAAVDAGGRVLLQGTFNFGEPVGEPYALAPNPPEAWAYPNGPSHVPAGGTLAASKNPAFWVSPPQTVFITNDVEIYGDGTTTIIGGYRTFTVGYRPLAGNEFVYDMNTDDGHLGPTAATLGDYPISPAKVTIENIHFDRSLNASIWLAATHTETRIVGNRFTNLQPLTERYWFGRQRALGVYTQGGVAGINFFTYLDTSVADMQGVLPRSDGIDSRTGTPVQGDLVVDDNIVDSETGGLIYAISLGGDVSITGNQVSTGFAFEQSVGVFGYFGHTVVARNRIDGLVGLRVSEDSFARNHPLTEAAGRTWAEGDWERATTDVKQNTIGGVFPLEVAISREALVRSNDLQASFFPGVFSDALYLWRSQGCTVRSNRIRGAAVFALNLDGSTGNRLQGNNLNGFEPQPFFDFLPPADIAFIFGADNNVAIGNGTNRRNNTYLEFLASGNLVTGYQPIAGALSAEETAAAAAALRGPGPLR